MKKTRLEVFISQGGFKAVIFHYNKIKRLLMKYSNWALKGVFLLKDDFF